jgi:formylglycine-generating enzyme required for sulfatase activity
MRSTVLFSLAFLSLILSTGSSFCEISPLEIPAPVPVEGTEMITTEFGIEFPKEIYWPKDGSIMVLIPHGTFIMGLNEDKGGALREGPEHSVSLPSFYIDKYEISNAQYERYLTQGSGAHPRPSGNPNLTSLRNPVVAIPWTAAFSYAHWAGKQLPTEAMWEKAATGPENFIYTTGDEIPSTTEVMVGKTLGDCTIPVDQNTGDISGYGVYHLGGNASEWVADWYEREFYSSSPTENPIGPAKGETRVIRGANYMSPLARARCSWRDAHPPTHIRDSVGIRTVWIPTNPQNLEGSGLPPTPSPTPEPSTVDILNWMIDGLSPFLEQDDPKLPRKLMASKAYRAQGEGEVQFINLTPWSVSLTAIGPNEELVYDYNLIIPKMTYRNISLAKERDLYIIAYIKDAPDPGPHNLGFVRSESHTIIVMKTELFGELFDKDGNKISLKEKKIAEQYYSGYSPMWNELEVQNPLDEPITIRTFNTTMNKDEPEFVAEYTMNANSLLRLSVLPGDYRITADYIGAMEDSSDGKDITVDKSAARRLLVLRKDEKHDGFVTVITQKKPFLALDLFQARSIGFDTKSN